MFDWTRGSGLTSSGSTGPTNDHTYSTTTGKYKGQDMTKLPYGCVHQNLAIVATAKYNLLRAFPENLKQLSSILTNIWRFEATYSTVC